MGFGAVLLSALLTPEGVAERMRRLKVGVGPMAAAAWGTVVTGTWIVYRWYREGDETSTPLSPRFQLLDDSTAITLFVMALVFAAVAGALGAFIKKVAPVR